MKQLTQSDLAIALDACATLLGQREFIVVGAVSIVGSYPEPPPGLTVSLDIDLFPPPDGTKDSTHAVMAHFGEGSEFQEENGFYIESVGRWTMQNAPAGWESRLIRTVTPNGAIGLWISPLDLAFVKLDVARDKDIQFVGVMLRAGIVSAEELKKAIASREADTRSRLENNLRRAERSASTG